MTQVYTFTLERNYGMIQTRWNKGRRRGGIGRVSQREIERERVERERESRSLWSDALKSRGLRKVFVVVGVFLLGGAGIHNLESLERREGNG